MAHQAGKIAGCDDRCLEGRKIVQMPDDGGIVVVVSTLPRLLCVVVPFLALLDSGLLFLPFAVMLRARVLAR